MKIEPENYISVKDIAKILNFSEKNAYKLVNQPDFPKIRIGRKILIPENKFYEFMNKHIGKEYTLI